MDDTSAGPPWPATDDVPDPLAAPEPTGELNEPEEPELLENGAAAERVVDDGQKK
jgi:hypothetical protein